MKDATPIDRRAEELANTGQFPDYLSLEPQLIDEFGLSQVVVYRQRRGTRARINRLCRASHKGA